MDEDFDDEELLLVTGRGSKAAGKKRNRKADDSEDEDERPARQQKPAAKRRAADSEDSESDDDGMDAEERAKLEGMNELEREMYLFEREEILQRKLERQQVVAQARKQEEQVGYSTCNSSSSSRLDAVVRMH
jgi:hypothetical protein